MIKPLFQHVLVVINGSQSSIWAAEYAILMSKVYGCTVKAVYVVDTATLRKLTISKFFVLEEFADYEKKLSEDGRRYLDYVADLGRQKKVKVATELRKGAVWTEVISVAVEAKANLILLGGYSDDRVVIKKTRPTHAIEFSNQEIIDHAPCSVIIVREKMIDQLFKIA
jgi:nucleotide-binding universal stress UspA family protein